jgi:hypothetical protein
MPPSAPALAEDPLPVQVEVQAPEQQPRSDRLTSVLCELEIAQDHSEQAWKHCQDLSQFGY